MLLGKIKSIGILVSYYLFIINYYILRYIFDLKYNENIFTFIYVFNHNKPLLKPHGYNVRACLSDWDLAVSNEQANPHVTETEPQWALHLESPFDPSSRAS